MFRTGWIAELVVDEVQDLRVACEVAHLLGLDGVHAERLVAQHRVPAVDGAADVVEMQERRRVHRDQIDVVTSAQRGDRVVVARRHQVDDLAPFGHLEHRRDDTRADAETDDTDPDRCPATHRR